MATEDNERMRRAYQVSGQVMREELQQERPDDARELDGVTPGEVVVVRGQYDRIEQVLEATLVPFQRTTPTRVAGVDWDRLQVLLVCCPGHLPPDALEAIGPWVRRGGYLLTTDWALKHVVEPLFPGTVRHNGEQTPDCVVRVESGDAGQDPLLAGFLEPGRDPLWWLEGASYPIEILDQSRVKVLVRSKEVGERWGADPVVVTFEEGHGTVLHLLSHLYLQRSDVREASDARPASVWLDAESSLPSARKAAYAAAAGDLTSAEMRSSHSTARFLANTIIEKKRRIIEERKRRTRRSRRGSSSPSSKENGGQS
jgi:hypothetical protein